MWALMRQVKSVGRSPLLFTCSLILLESLKEICLQKKKKRKKRKKERKEKNTIISEANQSVQSLQGNTNYGA